MINRRQEAIEFLKQTKQNALAIRDEIKKSKKEGNPTDLLEKQLDSAADQYLIAQSDLYNLIRFSEE